MADKNAMRLAADYLSHVAESHVEGAIYRGHADETWTLTPAAFRGPVAHGIRDNADLNRWKDVAARFAERPYTDLEWLVLAQHYGVGTTLLDWTTNPLVALYFACSPAYNKNTNTAPSGSVHMLPGKALPSAPTNRNWNPLERYSGPPLLINTLAMNKRTLAQDSVMTLHQQETSVPSGEFQTSFFQVKADQKKTLLFALKSLGISSDRVFVDIGVVAREFSEELQQAALQRMFGSEPNLAKSFG